MTTPDEEKKLEFLHMLPEKNPELRNQCKAFVRGNAPALTAESYIEGYIMEQTGSRAIPCHLKVCNSKIRVGAPFEEEREGYTRLSELI